MNPEQIKELQRRLQSKGLYQGEIDGKMGPATARAMALEQRMEPEKSEAEIQLELEKVKQAGKTEDRKAQEKREEAADPLWETFIPFGTGFVGGGGYGELVNWRWDQANKNRSQALGEIADELGPTDRLTASQLNRSRASGAAQAAERFAPTGKFSKGMNVLGRAASYGIPAGFIFNEFLNYQQRANEATTETERKANQQIANGLLGAATGIAAEGGARSFIPHIAEGQGRAEMRIRTAADLARRMDENDARPTRETVENRQPEQPKTQAPEKRPALPGSRSDLMEQAKKYGIKGRSKMTTAQLRDAVADAVKGTSPPRGGAATKLLRGIGPIAAGVTAAGATLAGDARADDGTRGRTTGRNLAEAGATGAATGGAAYGLNRLGEAVSRYAPNLVRSVGAGGMMALPGEIADATEQTPEQLNMARNKAARYLPEFMQFGAVGEAAEMAEVPERNPERMAPQGQPPMSPDEQLERALMEFEQTMARGY